MAITYNPVTKTWTFSDLDASPVFTLPAGDLAVIGNDLANRLTGNGIANTLMGGRGDDVLDGGGGDDNLFGGAGDDRYLLNGPGDTITESSARGATRS